VKRLGEILVEQGKIDRVTLERVLQSHKRLGDALVEEKLVTPTAIEVALEQQKVLQRAQADKRNQIDLSTIRIKSEKLDELMALVGELVTVHARITETASHFEGNGALTSIVEQFGRLTDSLRNTTMGIRMVPVGTTFSGFKRLVRDLSAELGKTIALETSGGETELDKSVIEKLHDPLIHIIRNSIDHGIEDPATREERGKDPCGTISLGATQAGAAVLITIEDDGNGLDKAAIVEKAIAKGLIQNGERLTEAEIFNLILQPGFSTKKQITAVSGRGVGMDVVNRQMESIGGRIGIESQERKGMTITLTIPLTLAIIDGLLVRVGAEYFVVPLSVVTGCLEFRRESGSSGDGVIVYQESQLPFIDLREYFAVPGEEPNIGQIVVVMLKDARYGLLVDQIIGNSQAVIKPLDGIYRGARGISSATIRGDGSIALILDVEQMMRAIVKE